MKVVILAGGLGTRLAEETVSMPKPMVAVGGHPILWHVMKLYAHWGYNEFVIALGYKGDVIKDYFINYAMRMSNLHVDLANATVTTTTRHREDWKIHLVDTGLNTLTGGRLRRLQHVLGDEPFLLTYGDGVSDVPVPKVVEFHRAQGKLATVTAVRPPARFGGIMFDGDHVTGFAEKRQTDEGWVNGGFMVLEPQVLSMLHRDEDVLEVDLLEQLAKKNEFVAYRHEGFWQCMDTVRDRQLLEKLWDSGKAPWKIWDDNNG
jgi:glucose-1-phosphate cytidylyltransferase